MLHEEQGGFGAHRHPHPDKLEITVLDSVYSTSKTNPSIAAAGYDPNSRTTTYKDGTTERVDRAAGGWARTGAVTTVSKIPDNFQQMGKETVDNRWQRNMLAPEGYL